MDYKRASREELEQLADRKEGEAICELGERYLHGTDGGEVNGAKAYKFFHRGEKMGLSRAYAGLGDMYQKGIYVARNEKLAREYYDKAGDTGITDAEIRSKLDQAEAARKGESYGRAKSLCREVMHTVEQICSGGLKYSGNGDVSDFLIEANWILAYTAFSEQDYTTMDAHLEFDGIYGRFPWSLYLAAVSHRIRQSPPVVLEQDLQMLCRVKENQNLSREERGDICAMIGDLAADGYGAGMGIKPEQAGAYYEEAMNCGNQYGRERYYEIN